MGEFLQYSAWGAATVMAALLMAVVGAHTVIPGNRRLRDTARLLAGALNRVWLIALGAIPPLVGTVGCIAT